jgi:AsmA-like protein
VGNWLNAAASIISTGAKATRIVIEKGRADMRRVSLAQSGSAAETPLDISLGQLVLTDGITLTNFKARLRPQNGMRGKFSANVNGGMAIEGDLFPQKNGMAIEVRSNDGGAVLRAAGLFSGAYGGKFRMLMVPGAGKGDYNGTMRMENTRLRGVSAMADLLNAISVIGLVQQLGGDGIHFNTVEGQFRLRPNGVQLTKASAVGASMGITLDGWYDSSRKQVDFQGVVTPIYMVNGMLQQLFGPLIGRQKGEGLLGFTYRMKGPAARPKTNVNPLSILTPGIFREIFRQPIPQPRTQ